MRLRVALDYRPALLSGAGIGRATRELARALASRDDVRLHLYAHSLARARVDAPPPGAATLHRLPIPGRALPTLARLHLGADRLAGSPRVFHWLDYVQAPLSRAAAIVTVHDLAFARDARWHGPAAATLLERTRRAVLGAAAVVVPSATTAADLQRFVPGAAAPSVIPFGADHVPEVVAKPPFAGDYVLCVGTIEPRKNHLTLLQAMRLLPSPRPPLVVIGRVGWQCDDVLTALREAAATGDVHWLPEIDDAALWSWLAHATVLAFPSWWEGFGFPPLEAMQLGVPVVAHDCAPMRELGDDAFVFADAGSAEDLARALARALHDAPTRSRAAANGRRRAATFRWADCAAAHAALYHEVAAC